MSLTFPLLLRAGFIAAALAGMASAQSTDEEPARDFVTPPDPAVVSDAFPVVAMATGVSGVATLLCDVERDGAPRCQVEQEEPAGYGFGAAALEVMSTLRFAPGEAEQRRVPVRFPTSATRAPVLDMITVTGIRGASAAAVTSADPALRRYYPQAAHVAGVEGRSLVACVVRSANAIDCAIEREEPTGFGFGEKALEVTQLTLNDQVRAVRGLVFRRPFEFVLSEPNEERAPRSMWSRAPTARQIIDAYPVRALADDVEGRVSLLCEIQAGGLLNCAVWNEQPTGWGFGDAARGFGQLYQLTESELGQPGRSIGDRIYIPVRFQVAH